MDLAVTVTVCCDKDHTTGLSFPRRDFDVLHIPKKSPINVNPIYPHSYPHDIPTISPFYITIKYPIRFF